MSEFLATAITPLSTLALAALAGSALGAIFFGGLWWTVRQSRASARPALWFLASLLLRMGITLPGFFIVASGRWERLLACLAGFVVARAVITWMTGQNNAPQETHHAP